MSDDRQRNIFEGPSVTDILAKSQEHITNVLEHHTREITELRVCQAKKLNEINQTINNKFDELSKVFIQHRTDEDTQCRLVTNNRDDKRADELKEIKNLIKDVRDKSVSKSLFNFIVTIAILAIGSLFAISMVNTKYVEAHKVETKQIIKTLDQHGHNIDEHLKQTYGIETDKEK